MDFINNDAATIPDIGDVRSSGHALESYALADAGMAPNWIELKHFGVFSAWGGNVLYANGRQQLKLIVVVQAVGSDYKVVKLSREEVESIHLVDAYTGTALPIDTIHEGERASWKCSLARNERFQPFPYSGDLRGPDTRGKDTVLREFFVSSNSLEPIKLVAAITRSDGRMFYSQDAAEYGHISLNTVPPAIYRKEQFRLSRSSVYLPATQNVAKVDRYVLDLILEQRHLKFVECNMPFKLQARSNHPDYLGYYVVPYFNGGKVESEIWAAWETADHVAASDDESGKMIVLLHFAKKGGRGQVRSDSLQAKVYLRDMYGNQHVLSLMLNTTGPTIVEII